jgi:thioredoxin
MSTINITQDLFEETVLADGIVLVDFWAEWCGPCKSFAPVFEASSEKHSDITFAKVDTEVEQQLSGGLGIQSIPTIMAFRDGVQVFSQPGALPEAALEDLIGQIEALDMEAIHKEIAEHQAAHADDHEHGPGCSH